MLNDLNYHVMEISHLFTPNCHSTKTLAKDNEKGRKIENETDREEKKHKHVYVGSAEVTSRDLLQC